MTRTDLITTMVALALALTLGSRVLHARAARSSEGLAVWYNFSEGSGATVRDLSGNSNHARLCGRAVWGRGRSGAAMVFNGVDAYLDCGNAESLRLVAGFSVCLWVKAGVPQPQPYAVMASWSKAGDPRVPGWALYAGCPSFPGAYPRFYTDPNAGSLRGYGPGSGTGHWQFLCVTYDREQKGIFYIDGQPHSQMKLSKPVLMHDGQLVLGRHIGAADRYYFKGAIDEFRLYERVLSAAEVADLHEAGQLGMKTPSEFALRDQIQLFPVAADWATLQWGENTVFVRCEVPLELREKGARCVLSVERGGDRLVHETTPTRGEAHAKLTLRVPEVAPGRVTLVSSVVLPDGRTLKRACQHLWICRRLVLGDPANMSPEPGEVLVFDNFSRLAPKVPDEREPGAWHSGRYTCLGSGARRPFLGSTGVTPLLRASVPLRGWHAVYLGLLSPGKGLQLSLGKAKEILEDVAPASEAPQVEDCFFRCIEFSGDEILTLNVPSSFQPNGLAYIKFVRLTDAQIALAKGEGDITSGKKFIFYNDGELFLFKHTLSAESIRRDVTHYRRKMPALDVFALTVGGSAMYYPTKAGTLIGAPDHRVYGGAKHVLLANNLLRLIANGQDPLQIAVEATRAHGIKLEVNLRMNWHYETGNPWNSKFRNEHPELRLKCWPGQALGSKLDYFHAPVREERLRIVSELASRYDVDAVNLDFLRWTTVMGMAAADSFQHKFGRAPDLANDDWEWFRYRAGFMTDFMRKARAVLDREGEKRGKRIELWAITHYEHFLRLGLDVETWIKEGLIDAVIAGNEGVNFSPDDVSVAKLVAMAKGTSCKVYTRLDLYMREDRPALDTVRRIFLHQLRQGADGIYLYNMAPFRSPDLYRNLDCWAEFEDAAKAPTAPIAVERMDTQQ